MPPGEYQSIPKCFLDAVDRFANPRAQLYRTDAGWQPIAATEMLRRVAGLSAALAKLGISSGTPSDSSPGARAGTPYGDRVAIFAPNCPEWATADLAVQGLGGVTVPIYFRESADRLIYILKDSGARIIFVSGQDQARLIAQQREHLPQVEQVICVAPPDDLRGDFLCYESLIEGAGDAEIAQYREAAKTIKPDCLATLIYTSGTTGEPKGVMLSHANLTSNALGFSQDFSFGPADLALSLLPLAHVYERTVDYGYLFRGVSIAYLEQPEAAAQALVEARPTTMAAVPRFYEKTYANIIDTGHRTRGLKRKIFDAAIRTAVQAVPWRAYGKSASLGTRLRWSIADKLVYSKIRAGVGGRISHFSSGGAPLAPELAEFFWVIGLPVYQGYGLTETSPVVTFNSPKSNRVGTVGRPIENVEIRLADDGEILVKGPCVMQGYYRKPAETADAISPDGWFRTGDIGRVDEAGFLIITDRKKELLKTAGGKFVAPAPIENLLRTSPLISNVMVVGDGRKFVSLLIVPNFQKIEREAAKAGREFSTPAQMVADPWVRDLISRELDRLTSHLAQYERPKRFALLEQDFTFANGEITYTLKLKRRVIEQRYHDVIARLYADVEEPRPQHLA